MVKDEEILNLKAIQEQTDLKMFKRADVQRVLHMSKDAVNQVFGSQFNSAGFISIGNLVKTMSSR